MSLTLKNKKAVLIVDPDDRARGSLRTFLLETLPELVVIESGDGADARAKISRQFFDLVVLETKLPKLDGSLLLKSLKDLSWEFVPKAVLIYSALVPESSVPTRSAYISYLNKGANLDPLKDYIQSLFEKTSSNSPVLDVSVMNAVFSGFLNKFRELTGMDLISGKIAVIANEPLRGEVAGVVEFSAEKTEGRILISFFDPAYLSILENISSKTGMPHGESGSYFVKNLAVHAAMQAERQARTSGQRLVLKNAGLIMGQNGIIGNWPDMTRVGASFGSALDPQTCSLEFQIQKRP